MKDINSLDKIDLQPSDLIGIVLMSILLLALLIYAIALLFQGFKTATNAKKTIHYVIFGIIILIVEITSKLVLSII